MVGVTGVLTFTLGGLSKSIGMPQVKLGWITVSGPDADVHAALDRLELINDTYLSASTPAQVAAATLLARGSAMRSEIASRIATNLDVLRTKIHAFPSVTLREPEGGWSAVIEVPAIVSEETLVIDLLRRQHVIVHPGYFFDFDREAFLVVSLLPEPEVFAQALDRLLPVVAGDRPA
jgi:aspartate/methionine/tyrosine aminotransferase